MAETDIRTLHEAAPKPGISGDAAGPDIVRLARASIRHGLVHREPLPINYDELPGAMAEPAATFTTLHIEGKLRGCCGTLEAVRPLAADVAYSAFRAAFRDPRFEPVGEHELSVIRLEVSVLSPLESMPVADEADLLNRLTPGVDGLVIVAEGRHATFLPKVWEMFPNPEHFLAALKTKCGLPGDYWSDRLEFRRYQSTCYADSGT
jgi:AmmeMemoRadiSam system protein A